MRIKYRILSVSEAAAIMGLDKKFTLYGNLSDKQQSCSNCITQHTSRFIKTIIKNALYSYENRYLQNKLIMI